MLQQISFGGKSLAQLAEQVAEQVKPALTNSSVWATIGAIALGSAETALAVATSPVTLTVAGVAGTAYLLHELSKEDDD